MLLGCPVTEHLLKYLAPLPKVGGPGEEAECDIADTVRIKLLVRAPAGQLFTKPRGIAKTFGGVFTKSMEPSIFM